MKKARFGLLYDLQYAFGYIKILRNFSNDSICFLVDF